MPRCTDFISAGILEDAYKIRLRAYFRAFEFLTRSFEFFRQISQKPLCNEDLIDRLSYPESLRTGGYQSVLRSFY